MLKRLLFFSLAGLSVVVAPAHGIIRLPSVFSDNMVLQEGAPVNVWGWASPGEKVKIELAGQVAELRPDNDGRWKATLGPVASSKPLRMVITGHNRISLRNILVGEVWLCSGQSNMEWSLARSAHAAKAIAGADHPAIRLFNVNRNAIGKPQDNCQGKWSLCTPQTAKGFSAVAYHFGAAIHKATGKPVGLIQSTWGGTPVEGWTSREALAKVKVAKAMLERWDAQSESYAKTRSTYALKLNVWEAARQKAQKEGRPAPRKPRAPLDPSSRPNNPGSLFNGMIHPLIPFSIRGATWYQGESNVSRAYQYRSLFPALIADWRARWGLGEFPFLFVQIAPYRYGRNAPEMGAELREAQLMTLRGVRNTGMAVTLDIGNPRDIHPRNKQEVGRRLARWALRDTYGKADVEPSGPIYKSHLVEDGAVVLEFDHVGGGLVSLDGQPLSHFAVAGEDRVFHPVDRADIVDGRAVRLVIRRVKTPVAVRFGWSDAAVPNLGNQAGLPASSFRTDSWPGKTHHNR